MHFTKGPRIFSSKLFKGMFYHCDGDPDVVTKQECLQRNVGKWVNRPYNFDDLAQVKKLFLDLFCHLSLLDYVILQIFQLVTSEDYLLFSFIDVSAGFVD